MSEIIFKELRVEHLCKPTIKHSYITIKPDDNGALIVLKTPKVSQKFIQNLLLEKESWIRKQLLKMQNRPKQDLSLEYEVILFGDVYSIDSTQAYPLHVALQKIRIRDEKKILECYDRFYLNFSKEYLSLRVEHYAELMDLQFSELKFKKLKSRWGSCNSNGVITLNTQLMKVKKEYSDYVVVHELAHLVHMNHSKEFHSLVDLYIPGSKFLRKEFKNIFYM